MLALFLPLAGFLILFFSANFIGRKLTAFIACSTILLSFLFFTHLLYDYTTLNLSPQIFKLYTWVPVEKINADFSLLLDPLSLLMTLIITGVGFLIHVYSIGYMDHEEDFARFFACLNFFVFSMLLLVLASNLLLLFVGWEGVGLASYLLIGFWYQRPAAAKAATKAFVVNRIGDLGLLLGLLLTFYTFGTGDITEVCDQAAKIFTVGAPILTILTLLYFVGAIGKSAQLPLHVWLPDAMEGPTPVSALIHAATMVTAGVYLVVRLHPLFLMAPATLTLIGIIGGCTALFAALSALGQTDLKRVLAYSTISQLGLMFLACGIGAFYAAMFHLTMHAFVKALLFLSAGNVVHMMHGTTQMAEMGGLRKIFKKTNILFIIGVLAMSGVPPLAAFFSKDLILEEEYLYGNIALFDIGLLVTILTAFYLTRAYCLTFTGKCNVPAGLKAEIKEAPRVMIIPVAILGLLSVCGGFLGYAKDHPPILERFLAKVDITHPDKALSTGFHFDFATWLSIAFALTGVIFAFILYTKFRDRLGKTLSILRKSFYIDEIYDTIIVSPLQWISILISNFFEPKIFDGGVEASTQGMRSIALTLQKMQSGQIRTYVGWMVVGAVFLIMYLAI